MSGIHCVRISNTQWQGSNSDSRTACNQTAFFYALDDTLVLQRSSAPPSLTPANEIVPLDKFERALSIGLRSQAGLRMIEL